MKKLIVLFLLFFSWLLSSNSYADNSYPKTIICEVEHFDGEIESHHFYRKNDEFLWINGENKYPLIITYEDDSYLFLNLSFNSMSINLGINKQSRKILMDGMNLEKSLLTTRVNGNCIFKI